MWYLKLLGVASIEDEEGNPPAKATRRHPLALLALLATAPSRTCSRDKLIALLWPDLDSARGRSRLRSTLHIVRSTLGSDAVRSVADDLRISPEVVRPDVADFLRALDEDDREQAVRLYRGPFLDGFHLNGGGEFEGWSEGERRRLDRLYEEAVEGLAEEAERKGDFTEAASWWSLLARRRPESSRRVGRLMELLTSAGERARALEWFDRHRRILKQDFATDPDEELVALAEELADRGKEPVREPVAVRPAPGDVSVATATAPPPSQGAGRIENGRRPTTRSVLLIAALVVLTVATGGLLTRAAADGDGRDGILVLTFENRTGDPSLDVAGQLAGDWIAARATETGLARVIPATVLAWSEPGLRRPAARRPEGEDRERFLRRIAGETEVEFVVGGYLFRRGDSLVYQARILDGRSGELLRVVPAAAGPASAPVDALPALQRQTVGALATVVDERFREWMQTGSPPPSFEAYQVYARGLERFLEGGTENYLAAAELFEEAARMDSSFTSPLPWAVRARHWGIDHAGAEALLRRIEPARERMSPWDRAMLDFQAAGLRGDLENSYRTARRMVELAPTSYWQSQLASAAYGLNRPRETIRILRQIDVSEGWISESVDPYHRLLVRALHRVGNHRAELEQVRRWQEMSSPRVLRELRPLAAMGEVEALERALEEALDEAEAAEAGSVLWEVARELQVHGHEAAADQFLSRSLDAFEGKPITTPSLPHARALMAAGRLDEARSMLEELSSRPPELWVFRGLLGVIAARQGEEEEARRHAEALAEMGGPYPYGEHLGWKAAIHAALGETDEVRETFRQARREGLWIHSAFHTREGMESLRCCDPRTFPF